ncbi:hypothetical protein ID866_10084 [Astraeus odoratus]|nr:hypothetical protein ID866_10084 [Astraeus odoratus]
MHVLHTTSNATPEARSSGVVANAGMPVATIIPDVDTPRIGMSVSYAPSSPAGGHVNSPTAAGSSSKRVLAPCVASEVNRYNRQVFINPATEIPKISAAQMAYDDPKDLAGTSWKSCTHPEGALYFWHAEYRIFTDSNVCNARNRRVVERCAERLVALANSMDIEFPKENVELVLELVSGQELHAKDKQCRYYFVDNQKKLLFWLHDWVPLRLFDNLRGVKELSHIGKAIEMQYCLIIHANAESITSETALAPFESAELSKMMDITPLEK